MSIFKPNIIKNIGRTGEELACRYLTRMGMTVRERNRRVGNREIDIICEDGEYIVFVEVKTRSASTAADEIALLQDLTLGALYSERPSRAINGEKKSNLLSAVNRYMKTENIPLIPRIDVVEIWLESDNASSEAGRIEYTRSAITNNTRRRLKK